MSALSPGAEGPEAVAMTHPKSHTPILMKAETLYSRLFPFNFLDVLPWTTGIEGADGILLRLTEFERSTEGQG
jgi:hypothetical protein